MAKNLNEKFLRHIKRKWYCHNTYDRTWKNLEEKSGVYIFTKFNKHDYTEEIVYIGSSTNLLTRYRIHKVPEKIQKTGYSSIMYFIELAKGFYDYEIKLIHKLNPEYNVQHKKN